ncbi:MAG: hypothetical protein ACLP4V_01060 [Methylocella sp.]
MQRDTAAQRSQFIERFDRMEHLIAAVAAASRGAALASGAVAARKQARGGRGHAFDPFQNPTAPDKETISHARARSRSRPERDIRGAGPVKWIKRRAAAGRRAV